VAKLILKSKHRVLCGDCTIKENVDRLMDGQKADMVFTDPPYGMALDTDYEKITDPKNAMHRKAGKDLCLGKKYNKVIGDDTEFIGKFILEFFPNCQEIFLWGADYYIETLERTHENLGSWVVWDKITTAAGVVSEGAGKMFGSQFELCWSKNKHKREIVRLFHKGFTSVDNSEKVHPTQKPVQLGEWFINRWGKDKQNTVDIFLGSGSTLIACEKTGRKCFGMEIDPHYCTVICQRYIDYVGTDENVFINRGGKKIKWQDLKK